jgi:hypothetical protein
VSTKDEKRRAKEEKKSSVDEEEDRDISKNISCMYYKVNK